MWQRHGRGYGLALDHQGAATITGRTESSNFPTVAPLQATNQGGPSAQDAFVAKVDPSLSGTASLRYSTYLGGNGDDQGASIAQDSAYAVYITGWTTSSVFPITSGARQLTFNGGGNDAFVTKLANAGRTVSYTYDGLQRLIGAAESPGNQYVYGYDLAGNRTAVQLNGGAPSTTTYNAANQITNAGYSYDDAGNLLADGTTTYSYDALSRMTARGSTTYAYNGDGTLVSQAAGGVTTHYTQDLASPLSQVLQLTVGSATPTDYLVYYQGDRGEVLAGVSGGTRTWYLYDALGSVRRTVSDTGTPLSIINYDPWGTPENGTVPTFGFTGELQDVTAGLVNLRARWYSTAQGRFTARDAFAGLMTAPQTLAPYPYAENDPVNRIDPSGNLAIFVAGRGSEDRSKDPLGNQAALISVWEMGARFAHEIPGETIIASWNAYQNIVQKVKSVATDTCPHEPIILVGHSLGADTIMQVAYELSDVHIDLLVTIDLANVSSDYRASRTPSNVGRHINFISDNAPRNLLTKLIIDVPDYVDGAENYRIAGSVHTTLDNEFLDDAHKYPNPVWSMTEQAILKLR